MAHNLNFNEQTGKHSFFSVKQKAWHGLGQIVEQYPTSAEALKFAGLDYTVEKRKLFTYDNENQNGNADTNIIIPEIEVSNFYATVRTDSETVLGVVERIMKLFKMWMPSVSLMLLLAVRASSTKPPEHWAKVNAFL